MWRYDIIYTIKSETMYMWSIYIFVLVQHEKEEEEFIKQREQRICERVTGYA